MVDIGEENGGRGIYICRWKIEKGKPTVYSPKEIPDSNKCKECSGYGFYRTLEGNYERCGFYKPVIYREGYKKSF